MEDETIKAPGFMVYRETAVMISMLSDDEAGKVIKSAVDYFLDGTELGLEGNAGRTLTAAVAGIDRSLKKYRRRVEANRQNGMKGGRPPEKPNANPV